LSVPNTTGMTVAHASMFAFTEDDIRAHALKWADEVTVFSVKALKVVNFVLENETAVNIERMLPHADKIVEALGGVAHILALGTRVVPMVNLAFTAYDIYRGLGGRAATTEELVALQQAKGQDDYFGPGG
jgi:hypothetical protein